MCCDPYITHENTKRMKAEKRQQSYTSRKSKLESEASLMGV